MDRLFYILAGGLLLFSLVCRASMTVNRGLAPDEFHFLHNGWMTSQGAVIYKDFWENHTPLQCYLLSPVMRQFGEGTSVILAARMIHSTAALGILVLTFVLARKLTNDRYVSLLAVVLLSLMSIFVQRTIEVRPDQVFVILWLLCLLLYMDANARPKAGRLFFTSGLILGVAWLLSPKALLAGAGLAVAAAVCWYRKRKDRPFGHFLKDHLYFLAGFLIPVAAGLLFLYHLGSLKQFFAYTILGNFSNPDVRRPLYLLRIKHLCFFLLGIFGIIHAVRDYRKRAPSDEELIVLSLTLVLMVIYLFVMPAAYPQSSLLFAPMLALYAARTLMASLRRIDSRHCSPIRHMVPAIAACAAGVIIPLAAVLWDAPFSVTNVEQFNRIRFVLNFTGPNDRIFDAESSYIFRPQAYYYSSLFAATRQRIAEGTIKRKIPDALISRRCRMIIRDQWINLLPTADVLFLRENYVSIIEPDIFVAGKRFVPWEFRNNKVAFELQIPGVYGLHVSDGSDIQKASLDAKPLLGPRFLRPGTHLLSIKGSFSSVELRTTLRPAGE